jgi:hypothetical protein
MDPTRSLADSTMLQGLYFGKVHRWTNVGMEPSFLVCFQPEKKVSEIAKSQLSNLP